MQKAHRQAASRKDRPLSGKARGQGTAPRRLASSEKALVPDHPVRLVARSECVRPPEASPARAGPGAWPLLAHTGCPSTVSDDQAEENAHLVLHVQPDWPGLAGGSLHTPGRKRPPNQLPEPAGLPASLGPARRDSGKVENQVPSTPTPTPAQGPSRRPPSSCSGSAAAKTPVTSAPLHFPKRAFHPGLLSAGSPALPSLQSLLPPLITHTHSSLCFSNVFITRLSWVFLCWLRAHWPRAGLHAGSRVCTTRAWTPGSRLPWVLGDQGDATEGSDSSVHMLPAG